MVRLSAADSSDTVSSGRLRRGSFMFQAFVRVGLEPCVVPGQGPRPGTSRNLVHVLHNWVLDNLRADLDPAPARATGAAANRLRPNEYSASRLRRARACAGLEDGGEPADGPAVLRTRQCRHRPGSEMRRAR